MVKQHCAYIIFLQNTCMVFTKYMWIREICCAICW